MGGLADIAYVDGSQAANYEYLDTALNPVQITSQILMYR